LLVERDAPPKEDPTKLIVTPDVAQEPEMFGTVVAVGPGVGDLRLGAGVRVYIPRHAGLALPEGPENPEKRMLILREDEILGVVG